MPNQDIKTYHAQNGLSETIEMSHATDRATVLRHERDGGAGEDEIDPTGFGHAGRLRRDFDPIYRRSGTK